MREEIEGAMVVAKLSARFVELLAQGDAIERTQKQRDSEFTGTSITVDGSLLLGWQVKCRNLLEAACGKDSAHYQQFVATERPQQFRDNLKEYQQLRAVLAAAQEDYDGGYLESVRALVRAELFSSELDQARELMSSGYLSPAAVVAGVVLETGLREMCEQNGVTAGKLDKMNADLAKRGLYDLLVQKRITAIADVRNNAAHGHPEKFKREDVEDMVAYVERFLTDYR